MLFNSLSFAIFLPIVFVIYWAVPHRFRWGLLLVASYYFYMSWDVKYVVLIVLTTLVSFLCGLGLERCKQKKTKKKIVALTLIICLGVLFFFKYFNWVGNSFVSLLQMLVIPAHEMTLKIMLPVGISFYTFQTLSYVIDVYRGDIAAEHHFGKYATFVSFFPQLVAGPIERPENLLPQIKKARSFSYEKATYGMKLMALGYFKKLVIANGISSYVDAVYVDVSAYTGFSFVCATVLFAIQIYCDFSGYSDIAIGSAKLFGIDLMTNFKSPYFSKSIREFWKMWHISLSTWFRDYVYIPLGGNRCSKLRNHLNLLITFLLSGLWHGADWTFVIWGGLHGTGQIIENTLPKQKTPASHLGRIFKNFLSTLLIFSFCCFTWIFFRAESIQDAIYIITHLFEGLASPVQYCMEGLTSMGLFAKRLFEIAFTIFLLFAYDFASRDTDLIQKSKALPGIARWAIYLLLLFVILVFTPIENNSEFIYFQF